MHGPRAPACAPRRPRQQLGHSQPCGRAAGTSAPRMRTARQRLGRGQVREPRPSRRLKSRPYAQAHGEFWPPARLLVPGRGWLLSGGSARDCAGVGLAHAHLCRRRARARAPRQRRQRRRFLSRGLRAAVGFEASGCAEGHGGGGGDSALGAGGSALLSEAGPESARLEERRRRLLRVTA